MWDVIVLIPDQCLSIYLNMMSLMTSGDVFDCVFLCCPFFPRDVLNEIRDLIESVSDGFPTYSYEIKFKM